MDEKKTRKRWTIEEMMSLYCLIEEKNGKGLDEFLEANPHRTREAARKRYNLIKSGKININEVYTSDVFHTTMDAALPEPKKEILFDIEDYKPFRPNIFVRVWRFIKKLFRHNE